MQCFLWPLLKVIIHRSRGEVSLKLAFCQKVQCSSNQSSEKCPKSGAENMNKLFTVMGGKFKLSAQDSDLEYFFEPHHTF